MKPDEELETKPLAVDVRAKLPTVSESREGMGRAAGDLYGNGQEEDSVRARWLIESRNKSLVLLGTQLRLLGRVLEGEIGTYPVFAAAMRGRERWGGVPMALGARGIVCCWRRGLLAGSGYGFLRPVWERGWASRIWSGSSLKIE